VEIHSEAEYYPFDAGLPGTPGKVDVLTIRVFRERQQDAATMKISGPGCAAHLLHRYLEGVDREHMVALLLDSRNYVIGVHTISIGSLNETIVHPREVFKAAILVGATGILMGHNHPSGDPSESPQDIATTRRMQKAGEVLGIKLLDHIILGRNRTFISFVERDLLKETHCVCRD
jgi:DNA repair protein RadC